MPQSRRPPRLWLKKGRAGRRSVYLILDGAKQVSTGYGPGSEQQAEEELANYILERSQAPTNPQSRENLTVGQVLAIYATEHAPHVSDPERIAYAIDALATFWADLPVSEVKARTCRDYIRTRDAGNGTVRRELGTLRAALNYCAIEDHLISAPDVMLPPKPDPRPRWMTRDEVAAFVRIARSTQQCDHLARFILIGVYTGTRPGAIFKLQWKPNEKGGHVDTAAGMLYRSASLGRSGKKRQTPARLPRQILGHLRRWEVLGGTYVIERRGKPIAKLAKGWKANAARVTKETDFDLSDTVPHTCRHTAATWLMQNSADRWEAAGFLGMSPATLDDVYGHHHPDHQKSAVAAMERRPNHGTNRGTASGGDF